jgi:phage-related protein
MASIYNVPVYIPSKTDYSKNDIVLGDGSVSGTTSGKFYYNLGNGNLIRPDNTGGQAYWGGSTIHNGSPKSHFFWKPSYSASLNKNPKVKSIRFGDGYEQRVQDGINNNLAFLDLTFDNRSEIEAAAILHFLEIRKGQESFVFTPHAPYNKAGLYLCRGWDSSFVFYDNYSIKLQLEEVTD